MVTKYQKEVANDVVFNLYYNSEREHLIIPEYGRHLQKLIEQATAIEDPIERNTTRVRVIKNRYSGETGKACAVLYDKHTGRMNEINEEAL